MKNNHLKKIGIGILGGVVFLGVCVGTIFGKEIKSINSIKLVDEYGMYSMNYYGDYGLDKLLEQGGVANDSELVSFTIQQILKGLPVEFNVPDFGCSTFQVQNAEGDWLFARNYDLDYVPSMILRTTPENGYASIGVCNLAIMGYNEENQPDSFFNNIMTLASPYTIMDGLNEKGLSIAVLMIKDDLTRQTGQDINMTTTSMIRYVLDKAKDVNEAIALFESVNMQSSSGVTYHFQLTDANGKSAIIEYVGDKMYVFKKENNPMLLTNFIIAEENYGHGQGHERYATILNALTASNGKMEVENAFALLQQVSKQYKELEADEDSQTQWSVVYNNTDLTMDITAGGGDVVHSFSLFR